MKSAFIRSTTRYTVLLLLAGWTHAVEDLQAGFDAYLNGNYPDAYRILLPRANDENPEILNLVALMLYQGKGAGPHPAVAHDLFHRAAELGVVDARRNLGILYATGAPGINVDYREAMRWFLKSAEDREATGAGDEPGGLVPAPIDTLIPVEFAADGPGKRTFGMYCSGCHGFNGLRLFSAAPSFAMGERMTKSDQELMHSILEGKGLMPSWKDKLSLAELEAALVYLRELALRTGFGTDPVTDLDVPETYFIFRPSGWREPEPAEQR